MKRYTKTDEWIKVENGVAKIGLSAYAIGELGDIVFFDLPEVGEVFKKGETFGAVESVKIASDLYMPIGGKVKSINEKLEATPEAVNEDPEGEYLIEITDFDEKELSDLLTKEAYGK